MRITLTCLGLGAAILLGSCQKEDASSADAALLNKHWMLTQVDNTPVSLSSYSEDYTSFIRFEASGHNTVGRAACHDIRGTYVLGPGARQLTISEQQAAATSCASPFLSDRYRAALPQTVRYELAGTTLRLYDQQSTTPRLIFQAAQ